MKGGGGKEKEIGLGKRKSEKEFIKGEMKNIS